MGESGNACNDTHRGGLPAKRIASFVQMPAEILYEERDHIGLITINRPEARNALTFNTYAEL